MLEREAVRSTISQLLGDAKAGRGGALFVVGEAGMGKTSILDEACEAAAADFDVGRATGDVMESSLAFGLAREALHSLGAPEVIEGAASGEPAPNVRGATFFRVLDALSTRALVRPVLLAVDDLHWADEDSLALFSFLCRRIARSPVAVIATLRPWPPPAREAALALVAQGHGTVEQLAPLSAGASGELMAQAAGRPLRPDEVAQALPLCAGNPFLLEHLALAMTRGDLDLGSAGTTTPAASAPDSLLLPRFAGLPPLGFRCAQAASVLGIRFRPAVAAEVALLDDAGEQEALAALSGSGLVHAHPDAEAFAEFVHPLLAQALYRDLGPPMRTVLHRRAFDALARRGLEAAAAEHAIRAHLVGEEAAIDLVERVGRSALRAGAVALAIRLLGAAAELAGEAASDPLLLTLAMALVDGGQHDRAIETAGRVLRRVTGTAMGARPAVQAGALRILGHAQYAAGHHDLAAASFDEAVRLAEADEPGLAVEALLLHSVLLALTVGPVPCLPVAARARRIGERAGDALARRAEGTWGYVAVLAGEVAGFEAVARAAAALGNDARFSPPRDAWRDITMYGAAAKYGERFEDSERLYRLLGPSAELAESPAAIAAICTGHAETLIRVGRLREARVLATRACEVAELATHVTATLAATTMAHVLLLMDRLEESDDWCDRAEAMATAGRDEWLPLLRIYDLRGVRLLRQGRAADAAGVYGRARKLTSRVELGEPCVVPWAGHAIAAFAGSRRIDEALGVLEWIEGSAAVLPCRWPALAASVGRAVLDERDGNHDSAEAHFRAALDLHQEVDLPLDRAETLVAYGGFLRRRGRMVTARPILAEAVRFADAAGAAWLAATAHEELSLAGGRRRATADPNALTPSEARVARLAAGGASNLDIAGQLLLSVNTVESHLRRAYAKLGIRSRRDLIVMSATWDEDKPA